MDPFSCFISHTVHLTLSIYMYSKHSFDDRDLSPRCSMCLSICEDEVYDERIARKSSARPLGFAVDDNVLYDAEGRKVVIVPSRGDGKSSRSVSPELNTGSARNRKQSSS